MNTIEVGKKFERSTFPVLKKEGFRVLEHSSKKNWEKCYDFIVKKKGKKSYLEVRGRMTGRYPNLFSITKRKLRNLRRLKKNVLILCINKEGYMILNLKDVKKHARYAYIHGKKIYVLVNKSQDKLKEKRKKPVFIKCANCNHKWNYRGQMAFCATCPNCMYKVNIKKARKKKR